MTGNDPTVTYPAVMLTASIEAARRDGDHGESTTLTLTGYLTDHGPEWDRQGLPGRFSLGEEWVTIARGAGGAVHNEHSEQSPQADWSDQPQLSSVDEMRAYLRGVVADARELDPAWPGLRLHSERSAPGR